MPLHALGVDTPLHELKSELFKALAHPVRVRALELLVTGPRAVADMLVETGMEASHLSQHLSVLRRSGLVTAQREGNTVTYRLAHPEVANLLTVARAVLLQALGTSTDALTALLHQDDEQQNRDHQSDGTP
ncbi:metalloregulator ArsR/SmtB family transcription factor [Sanguibacter sp. 25GB23B1]|uniref:ArsR/SmtB family transcription factor n=1 Tax=unclassified Sanguibacter TaxID=2645534 RepID=UPI0032AF65D1